MSKKRKFKKISFKLSSRQINTINKFCKTNKTTKNKLIKKAIKEFLDANSSFLEEDKYHISENQLQLFEIIGTEEKEEKDHQIADKQLLLFNSVEEKNIEKN